MAKRMNKKKAYPLSYVSSFLPTIKLNRKKMVAKRIPFFRRILNKSKLSSIVVFPKKIFAKKNRKKKLTRSTKIIGLVLSKKLANI